MFVYARVDHTHSMYVSLWRCVRGGEGGHTPVPAADIERDRAWDPQRFSPPEDKRKEKITSTKNKLQNISLDSTIVPSWRMLSKTNSKKSMLGRQGINISQ
jgi:hypothetical protein